MTRRHTLRDGLSEGAFLETAFGECCDTEGTTPPVHAWFPLDRPFAVVAVLVASLAVYHHSPQQ